MHLFKKLLKLREAEPERAKITIEHAGKKVEINVYSSEFMAMDVHKEYRELLKKIAEDFRAHEIHGH